MPEKSGVESHRDTARHLQGGRGARHVLYQTGYQNHGLQEPFDLTDNLHKQGTYY